MSEKPKRDPRIIALRNFAISITVFNIFGFTVLGFEQPWLWPFVALATGYTTEIVLEIIGARAEGRAPRFVGNGLRGLVEFLYPAHITSLVVNMLLYVNDRVLVMMFGVMVGISGKWLLRVPVNGRLRHFMNPSNFGIAVVLLLFSWVSVAPPYHFTEYVEGWLDWLVPALILTFGTMLNAMLTKRMWLIGSWLVVFALQAIVRGWILDTSIPAALSVMTGVAFVLFTNYMITDPGTSPARPLSQVAFGGGVALLYGALTGAGIVYGLFFATALICTVRGGFLWSLHIVRKAQKQREAQSGPAVPATSSNGRPAITVAPTMAREEVKA
ncbi:enediyne biosynthesis protein [Micromonospora sp. SL1-18]|uniref:enediyne biosynthesis protein n=1 Tax=Micromonospora sp. SL1-18 TaxID=3399128 RepID=UPI003A4E555D